ncbi:MAG: hypothetical protein AB7M05_19955 [Alphaproteobacteria bacterium]
MNAFPSNMVRHIAIAGGLCAMTMLTASCKTTGSGEVPPGSPDFQAGYSDGCVSGYGDAGRRGMEDVFVKNTARFNGNQQYHEGWLQGYAACYQSEASQPMMGIR